jgi:hypothetical protein
MMKSDKPSIKIIKRDERESASHEAPPRADKEDSSSDFKGKANSTVAGWVREFQHRRRTEHLKQI